MANPNNPYGDPHTDPGVPGPITGAQDQYGLFDPQQDPSEIAGTGGRGDTTGWNKDVQFSYGGQPYQVDQWGNYIPGTSGADQASQRFQNLGAQYGGAFQSGYGNAAADRNAAASDAQAGWALQRSGRDLQMGARNGDQSQALGYLQQAAAGNAPSAAQIQQQQGVDAAIRSQQALAASARGPAALGNAQAQAAGNTAALQQQAVNQSALLRAQEMAQARGQYSGAADAMRGQDIQTRGQDIQAAGQLRGQDIQQQGVDISQQGLGLQGQLGFEGLGNSVENAQLQAGAAEQGVDLQQWAQQGAWDQGNVNRTVGGYTAGLSAVGSSWAGSDERMKTGIRPEGGAAYAPRIPDGATRFSPPGAAATARRAAELADRFPLSPGEPFEGRMERPVEGYLRPFTPPFIEPRRQYLISSENTKHFVMPEGPRLTTISETHTPANPISNDAHEQFAFKARNVPGEGKEKGAQPVERREPTLGDRANAAFSAAGAYLTSDARAKRDVYEEGMLRGAQQMQGQLAAQLRGFDPVTRKATTEQETTRLGPEEESAFQGWARQRGISDVDHPDSHYDYRGAFRAGVEPGPDRHWPDTFKQHGHPTFSEESQYSRGPGDGGRWDGGRFLPPAQRDLGELDDPRTAAPARMMDQLRPYSFNYKPGVPGEDPGRRRFGVMAQDLQKSPMGASVVDDTAKGKVIDTRHASGAQFAALANLHQRVKGLEAERAAPQESDAQRAAYRRTLNRELGQRLGTYWGGIEHANPYGEDED